MKRLSICIPTYNREKYLEELINCIINQVSGEEKEKVEICVSDNASTDNTEKMLKKYKGIIDIVYNKNKENIGPDLNYLKSVEIARGEYCWLMGSDDQIEDDGIKYLLSEIEKVKVGEVSLFLSNRINCDFEMKKKTPDYFMEKNCLGKIFDFNNEEDILSYFRNANSIGAVFSYLSSIIVNRIDWLNIKYDDSFTGTAYSHVYILLKILFEGKRIKILEKHLPLNRTGNDSFFQNLKQRVYLDFQGYLKLGYSIIKNEKQRKEFLLILTRERKEKMLKRIVRLHGMTFEEINLLKEIGYSNGTIKKIEKLNNFRFRLFFELYYNSRKRIRLLIDFLNYWCSNYNDK